MPRGGSCSAGRALGARQARAGGPRARRRSRSRPGRLRRRPRGRSVQVFGAKGIPSMGPGTFNLARILLRHDLVAKARPARSGPALSTARGRANSTAPAHRSRPPIGAKAVPARAETAPQRPRRCLAATRYAAPTAPPRQGFDAGLCGGGLGGTRNRRNRSRKRQSPRRAARKPSRDRVEIGREPRRREAENTARAGQKRTKNRVERGQRERGSGQQKSGARPLILWGAGGGAWPRIRRPPPALAAGLGAAPPQPGGFAPAGRQNAVPRAEKNLSTAGRRPVWALRPTAARHQDPANTRPPPAGGARVGPPGGGAVSRPTAAPPPGGPKCPLRGTAAWCGSGDRRIKTKPLPRSL